MKMTQVSRRVALFGLGMVLLGFAGACSKTPKNLGEKMEQQAKRAADTIKSETGIALDYSVTSVKFVEQTLGRLADTIGKTDPAKANAEAETYGAYVGECLRKKHGGEWAEEKAEGKSVYNLKTSSGATFTPVTWCYERITGTEQQNVYKKVLAEVPAAAGKK